MRPDAACATLGYDLCPLPPRTLGRAGISFPPEGEGRAQGRSPPGSVRSLRRHDEYEALQDALESNAAVHEMISSKETQFDPNYVDAFVTAWEEGKMTQILGQGAAERLPEDSRGNSKTLRPLADPLAWMQRAPESKEAPISEEAC